MEPQILEFHNWRMLPPDDDNELIALFHFSLMPEALRKSGRKPQHDDCFWTEVGLHRLIAEEPGWRKLGRKAKIKVMFRHAQEKIKEARRKLRQAPIFWTATSEHLDGPAYDPGEIRFPGAPPVRADWEDRESAIRFTARKGAGL